MSQYILTIDQGTTGTTVLVINKEIEILAKQNIEFKQYYPQPGWVEHDPEEIWSVTLQAIDQALQEASIDVHQIAAIGITNQRETTVLWDKATSQSVHPAIVWQDRRTAEVCAKLKKTKGLETKVRKKTGLVLDPYFSATKIQWLLKNVVVTKSLLKKHQLAFGTIDSFLVWKLTDGQSHVTEVSNASRTLLMNLHTLEWDKDLLKLFQIPASILPKICSSSEIYGYTKNIPGLPDGIPVAGMAGDQQAALFGQLCVRPGMAKCTYGTGSFLLMNIGHKPVVSKFGLLTTVAWKLRQDVTYALEGSVFIAGAAIQWLRDGLKIINKASEIEALAKTVADNGGVYFVPALAGLGAPYWNPLARGLLCGLTRGSERGHIARAALEGVAFSQYDILHAMQKDSGAKLKMLKVDGGACANNMLMQFQSDVLGCDIIRPEIIETTALGAAFFAGLAVGFWKSQEEIQKSFRINKRFSPIMKKQERQKALEDWAVAVKRVL